MTDLRTGAPPSLLALLDGLVALADAITEAGDRLTAPGNFQNQTDRHARGQLLAAMATCLALGAEQPGGITWAGAHWCTAPHPDCPKDTR